jgi:hypothetical protein
VAVFSAAHAPAGIEPFTVLADDVYCVLDPDSPELANLEAAVRLARLLCLASLRETAHEVDAAAIATALRGIREQVEAVRAMKAQLTSIGNATKNVWTGLDRMKEGVLARVAEVEAELRAVAAADGP